MNKWTVTAHVGIVCLALVVGLSQVRSIIYCFYSAPGCELPNGYLAFTVGFLVTAGVLYGVWGLGFFVTRMVRRIRT